MSKTAAAKTVTMSTPATKTDALGQPRTQSENEALLKRIEELTRETINHPQVVNKSPEGVASRVAKLLNREGKFKCTAHRFWTGAHVLMVSIPSKQ